VWQVALGVLGVLWVLGMLQALGVLRELRLLQALPELWSLRALLLAVLVQAQPMIVRRAPYLTLNPREQIPAESRSRQTATRFVTFQHATLPLVTNLQQIGFAILVCINLARTGRQFILGVFPARRLWTGDR